jgi:aminoglycoside 3-N-acetyltransferase
MPSLKERWLRKGFRRTADRYFSRVVRRTTAAGLADSFTRLDIDPGAVICVHSALSSLGHLVDGPESVVRALRQAVPDCTIMMPSFPFSASMFDYVASKPVFDPQRTPSMSGSLSEAFRNMPGVRRGLHPTHPCTALGPKAEELILGSELSVEPFGDYSTFGRFSARGDAVVLLVHSNTISIAHRFQEIVNWPNLFLPELFDVDGLDEAGARRTYSVRVHTPSLPQYLVLAADGAGPTEWVWLANYCVQFPEQTARRMAEGLADTPAKRAMLDRQSHFVATGTFRRTRHGAAEILAIRVKPWQERICQDLRDNLADFGSCYTLDQLQVAHRMGQLTH